MNSTSGLELLFLGTGTSVGVPVINCDCAVCTSNDPRNKRLRASVFLRTPECQWVVDTGPDFRQQCLRAGIRHLDAVLFTHAHSDHMMGFDDLRRFTVGMEARLPIHAIPSCMEVLQRIFTYAFDGSNMYPGYIKPVPRLIEGPFWLGETEVIPLPVTHGNVETIGFLFRRGGKRLAYLPDCKMVPDETRELLREVDVLITDSVQLRQHFTHMNLDEALAFAADVKAKRCWLTHFSCNIDHEKIEASLPKGVALSYDGLKISI